MAKKTSRRKTRVTHKHIGMCPRCKKTKELHTLRAMKVTGCAECLSIFLDVLEEDPLR